MIYLDNSATSYPKPKSVIEAVDFSLKNLSANPGRSGHKMSLNASRALSEARFAASAMLGSQIDDVFFTFSCTDALSCVIFGFLKPGDHVITTIYEHNSVLRPLEYLRSLGKITYDCIKPDVDGNITPEVINKYKRRTTSMVIINHISNVCGKVCSIEPIYHYCKANNITLCLDAAQSAGCKHISANMADIICMPGHKGLLGPMGSGLMYINPGVDINPLRMGGTGSQSESLVQPIFRPDRYESGTLALPAICGLEAGIREVYTHEDEIGRQETVLAQMLTDGIRNINGVKILSPQTCESGVVLFNIKDLDSRRVSYLLDKDFDIATRAGYHCAPLIHRYLGTETQGGVRASVGYNNTAEEISSAIDAIDQISSSE